MSKLSKSEPTYPYSILMPESKVMREKNIEPEIYREVEVTNNGWVCWISLSREHPNPRPGFLGNPILKGNID